VLSSDEVVHELLGTPEVVELLVSRWGQAVAVDGRIDRDAVAQIVFKAPDELRWLEQTLFPRVGARTAAWRAELEREGAEVAVVEVPLLFEAGSEGAFDATVAVVADEELRRERAAARGHHAVDERAGRQLSQADKAARADYVVANDGSLDDLEAAMRDEIEQLRARQERGPA
jgi:dephospho-CoA kinase